MESAWSSQSLRSSRYPSASLDRSSRLPRLGRVDFQDSMSGVGQDDNPAEFISRFLERGLDPGDTLLDGDGIIVLAEYEQAGALQPLCGRDGVVIDIQMIEPAGVTHLLLFIEFFSVQLLGKGWQKIGQLWGSA